MQIFSQINKLQLYLNNKKNIALVPTMGGLHSGHLSLIEIAQKNSDIVVVSIFVNPAQFGINEDFTTYPRMLDKDIQVLKIKKVAVVFIPSIDEIYPEDYNFTYEIGYLDTVFCAKTRPTFFSGIVKVVYRLFDIIKPNIAVFGEKDYQQLLIIKKMVVDFNLPIKILSGLTIRENSGLAKSSRNQYLTKDELKIASYLYSILKQAKNKLNQQSLATLQNRIKQQLENFFILEYCEIIDSKNLGKITISTTEVIILVVVYLNKVRLIDNIQGKINV